MARLGRAEPHVDLPEVTLARHRDVLDVEARQAELLLELLAPADASSQEPACLAAERLGWSIDTLMPYLVRDWTGTAELRTASGLIGAALHLAFPDPRGRSVAYAGCGAGGLLAHVPRGFARAVGFDLALPIVAAARHLLDGAALKLPLPRTLNADGQVTLRGEAPGLPVQLVAMDALETAFPDGSIDGAVTMFLTDILPDPCALAREVHRVLKDGGAWINYGPSGNDLRALWRFDAAEGVAFFAANGFAVEYVEARRGTNLDTSAVCPPVSFRSPICYLTVARKAGQARPARARPAPPAAALREIVPVHFPGARLIHRLEATDGGIAFRHERAPGRAEEWTVGVRAARMLSLVDGKRTVGEIAHRLHRQDPAQPIEELIAGFERFFGQGLLGWRAE